MSYFVEVSYQDIQDDSYAIWNGVYNDIYYKHVKVIHDCSASEFLGMSYTSFLYTSLTSADYNNFFITPSCRSEGFAKLNQRSTDNNDKRFFIELEGSAPVSQPYNTDCPFTYSLYINKVVFLDITQYQKTLTIWNGTKVVYDKPLNYDYNYNSNYAESIMQTFIDDCIANLKIKTTCCVLVCCEPDKYELIT